MNIHHRCAPLILMALMLSGCNPETDTAYERGYSAGKAMMLKRAQSQDAEIAKLRSTQRQAAFNTACTSSLVCSLSHRLAGVAPPNADTQPDPYALRHYITSLRIADGLSAAILMLVLPLLWLPLLTLRQRLKLVEQNAQIEENQAIRKRLLNDIAELEGQRLTLEHARQLASRNLQAAINDLKHRQNAIEAQKRTKERLEQEVREIRKTLARLKSSDREQNTWPPLSPPKAIAKSIFEPRKPE